MVSFLYVEKDIKKQNEMLDNAIEALENAIKYFEKVGGEKRCDINTCNGCKHLFKVLMAFREGVKENNRKKISDSVTQLREAKICYSGAENELGAKTVEVLIRSFDYLEELIQSKEQKSVRIITDEFIEIIDELSSVGLQRIVKALTFDESMKLKKTESIGSSGNVHFGNVSGGNINLGHVAGDMNACVSDGKKDNKLSIPDAATLAGYFGWVAGGVLLYYGYDQSNIISIVGSVLIFVFLVARKLKNR